MGGDQAPNQEPNPSQGNMMFQDVSDRAFTKLQKVEKQIITYGSKPTRKNLLRLNSVTQLKVLLLATVLLIRNVYAAQEAELPGITPKELITNVVMLDIDETCGKDHGLTLLQNPDKTVTYSKPTQDAIVKLKNLLHQTVLDVSEEILEAIPNKNLSHVDYTRGEAPYLFKCYFSCAEEKFADLEEQITNRVREVLMEEKAFTQELMIAPENNIFFGIAKRDRYLYEELVGKRTFDGGFDDWAAKNAYFTLIIFEKHPGIEKFIKKIRNDPTKALRFCTMGAKSNKLTVVMDLMKFKQPQKAIIITIFMEDFREDTQKKELGALLSNGRQSELMKELRGLADCPYYDKMTIYHCFIRCHPERIYFIDDNVRVSSRKYRVFLPNGEPIPTSQYSQVLEFTHQKGSWDVEQIEEELNVHCQKSSLLIQNGEDTILLLDFKEKGKTSGFRNGKKWAKYHAFRFTPEVLRTSFRNQNFETTDISLRKSKESNGMITQVKANNAFYNVTDDNDRAVMKAWTTHHWKCVKKRRRLLTMAQRNEYM